MISSILNTKNNFLWTLIHIFIGLICVFYPNTLIIWFYLVIFSNFNKIISSFLFNKSTHYLFPFIFYISSFEVLARMMGLSPYIPWELSKYLFISMSILLIAINKIDIKMNLGFLLLLLLIPSLIVQKSYMVDFSDITSYLFGPISMALLVIVLSDYKINKSLYDGILRLIWLTSIVMLIYVFIKTPNYSELTFSLSADFETTGGFGSNQVSTILGAGMFLSFYAWMNKFLFSGSHKLDGIFIGLFAYQGFLTFSRGGMVVSVSAILVYYILFRTSNSYEEIKYKKSLNPFYYFLITITILISAFGIIQIISSGNIVLRYLGETDGTLAGDKIKTINTITTGRFNIFLADLNLWYENFTFGVGAGGSKFLRGNNLSGLAPHIEVSRILAEHGLFGLIFIFILIYLGKKIYKTNSGDINRAILLSLFFIGMTSTMHSSLRTFVTPVFIGLSTVSILKDEN